MKYRRIGWIVVLAVLLMIGGGIAIKWYCGTYTCFERKFERWAKDSGITAEDIEPFFTFTYGGYQYCYKGYYPGKVGEPGVDWQRKEKEYDGWSVLYLENDTEPDWILEEAFGFPVKGMNSCYEYRHDLLKVKNIPSQVVEMRHCFFDCQKLQQAPEIPEGVTDMAYCFMCCWALEECGKLPDKLEDMESCFEDCRALRTGPRIPASVTNMATAFASCYCLSGDLVIDASPVRYDDCFYHCSGRDGAKVVLSGKAPREVLEALKETGGFVSAKNFTVKTESTE